MHHNICSWCSRNYEAQAEDEGANGVNSGNDGRGDGRPSGHDSNSRFVCINNNDNTVTTGANEDNGGETDPCAVVEACFEDFLSPEDFDTLTMALENGLDLIDRRTTRNIKQFCRYMRST